MSNILFDISGKIEPSYINALSEIEKISRQLDIPFFVVGATARDFMLDYFYNIKAPRMTRDIDLGVEVPDWKKFEMLSDSLLATGRFSKAREKHRYVYDNIIIDIVPFGAISDENKNIRWPPEQEIIMSTMGFEEAYRFSVNIRIRKKPLLKVKVPTISGLVIMKLISWHEKCPERTKDAEDILFIMKNYVDTVDKDRLYEQEITVLEEEDFDNQIACIRLLGRDMAKMSNTDTLNKVKEILSGETSEHSYYKLISDMVSFHDDFDKILFLIKKLKSGVFEADE